MTERAFETWELSALYGAPVLLLKSSPSTHAEMRSLFGKIPPGTLIVADEQSEGRGRHERKWQSPAGKNLYFNILLPVKAKKLSQASQIMQIAALSMAELFRKMGAAKVNVKWPNDLVSEGRKLCGVISEILPANGSFLMSLGIGLNVNVSAEFLAGVGRPATSLAILLGRELNREALLQSIVDELGRALKLYEERGMAPWLEAWRKMDQFIGAHARIVEGETFIPGTVLGVNDDGSLSFQREDGQILSIHSGDLEI